MRFHTFLVWSALTLVSARVVVAQSALPLEGRWEGTLPADPVRGSRELGSRTPPPSPVFFVISTTSDGTYAGKWLNSGAGTKGFGDIGEVAIDGDAVRIDVPTSGGVWEGTLSSDGLTLTGEWRQGGTTTPLVLRRTGNADEPVRIEQHSPGAVTTTR